jgi:hypothetical protein
MADVFVSHSSADKPLVDDLFDLLQTGCDLRRESIFCSSVDGAGIETGAEFVAWINDNLGDARLVLLVLSPNYYSSKFCLAEMGAAWALGKEVFPLMLPGTVRDPGVVFLGRQSAALDQQGLDNLRDRLAVHFSSAGKATARWSLKRDAFVDRISSIIPILSKPALVEASQLEQEQERAAAAIQLYRELEDQNRELRERVNLLEKAKDAEEVRRITAQFTRAVERVSVLQKEVRSRLSDFGRVEVRAIYAAISDDAWVPARETWEYWDSDIEKAIKSKWVLKHELFGGAEAYVADFEHPRYRSVAEDLQELQATIGELPASVREAMEAEQECLLDIRNWQFWEDFLVYGGLLE